VEDGVGAVVVPHSFTGVLADTANGIISETRKPATRKLATKLRTAKYLRVLNNVVLRRVDGNRVEDRVMVDTPIVEQCETMLFCQPVDYSNATSQKGVKAVLDSKLLISIPCLSSMILFVFYLPCGRER